MSEAQGQEITEAMPSFVGMSIDRVRRILKVMNREGAQIQLVPVRFRRNRVSAQVPEAGAAFPEDPKEIQLSVEVENPDRFLPEVFREWDLQGVDFRGNTRPLGLLARFRYIPHTNYSWMEDWQSTANRNFNADEAPAHFLPFLESLFPFEVYSGWSVKERRRVLTRLPELLKKRGTAEGIALMVELYTGVTVKVHEMDWPFRGAVIGGQPLGDEPVVSQVPSALDSFWIELPTRDMPRELIERIHRVVDAEKPAHLQYCLYAPPGEPAMDSDGAPLGDGFIINESMVGGPIGTPLARINVPDAQAKGVAGLDDDWRAITARRDVPKGWDLPLFDFGEEGLE